MSCLFGAKCRELVGSGHASHAGPAAQCVCEDTCGAPPKARAGAAQLRRSPYFGWQADLGTSLGAQGEVCGSDANTYASECQLKLYSCRIQESIVALSAGPCRRMFS